MPSLSRFPRKPQGFALITALMLMGFILLLLITLVSVTRVESQQSARNKQVMLARQNALLALNVAVGQLQKYAGPDQRTTASANIDASWADSTTANGNWLGAYGNATSASYSATPSTLSASITGNSDGKGSQAKLLNWLVSGNENILTLGVAADGHITSSPSAFDYAPDSAVDLTQVSTSPTATDAQVLLIGENSVARSADYVAAPLVDIPSITNNDTTGRFAWWVGDEGAKANVTMDMASDDQLEAAFVSAQRAAIELVDKAYSASYDPSNLVGTNFDPSTSASTKLNNLNDLTLVAAQSATDMETTIRTNFHSLTPYSESLLVDSYAGGLKKDLSAILATGATSPLDSEYLFTTESGSGDGFGVPSWGMLRSFAQTTAPATGLVPQLPTTTQIGISPVLTYFALGLEYVAPDGASDGARIRLAMYPVVVLWNPYTVPIAASQYEVGYTDRTYARLQLQMNDSADPLAPNWVAKETIDFSQGASSGTYRSYVRFLIDAPTIEPGESLIFTLPDSESGNDYEAPQNDLPTNILTNTEGYKAYNHVLLNRNNLTFAPGEAGNDYRVSINNTGYEFVGETARFNMQRGESDVYLGTVANGRADYVTNDANDKEWYQSINRITQGNGGAPDDLFQDEHPLDYPTGPTAVISFNKMFSETSASPNTYVETRWIAQNNPRAPLITRTNQDGQPLNYFGRANKGISLDQFTMESTLKRASAGDALDSAVEIVDATLFEFRPATEPLISLGQLQHANLSMLSTYPAYPLGNSIGDFHFKDQLDQVYQSMQGENYSTRPTNSIEAYYDVSWLLNHHFWDRYFVSTVPHQGTGTSSDSNSSPIPDELPNRRIIQNDTLSDSDLRDADLAASGLTLNGGFNINSTSEQAWRAVLGGINKLAYNPEAGTSSSLELESPLPRFSRPTSTTGNKSWAWQGYRQLTEEQIAELAKNIVAEIRARGPFVSMADFINRRLVDNTSTTKDERYSGTLQSAIDTTYTGSAAVNAGESNSYASKGDNPFYDSAPNPPTGGSGYNNYDLDLMKGYEGTTDSERASGSKSAFAPQFLTQADVLSAIGAGLSARSDTFVIRTYGEVINPLTQESEGRIWCEAVVQRQLDFIDDATNNPEDDYSSLSGDNQNFGRKFKLVSFRWLSPEQI